ncbi:MAG: IPT/TIG domain-containing protein [Candidatus Dormibacter sp.]
MIRLLQRLITGTTVGLVCLALSGTPALAATKAKPSLPRPTAPGQARKVGPPPPVVFQVNPIKVNPAQQPNILIIGQHLSATTTVQVGGHPATTIEAPDPQTLRVQVPLDLANGSYPVAVTNEGGTVLADDQLVIDGSGSGPDNLTTMAGAGFLILLVVVMRLSRTPGLA